uniref:Coenzyme Q-binding protein COQ10 START domain-containing protein n=1 Tax=Ditylum brightwellii TaxID=49249 RepID=A0A6U3TX07_9STRA|mmetsp:Transcript_23814/g.35561  ORF Transcript_23814/g.35561 Transcript_23814/m.35561 type:complete len:402 (+) Transcript_23814:98-1303(+)
MSVKLESCSLRLYATMITFAFSALLVRGFTTNSVSLLPFKVSNQSFFSGHHRNSPLTDIPSNFPATWNRGTPVFPRKLPGSMSTTSLMAWWMPSGIPNAFNAGSVEDTIAVDIERTSPNSRRIMGEISIPASLEDVWSILTDYDNLTVHVPNLVESKRIDSRFNTVGEPGDGSYRCRLYQRGSQNIIGFEFGASVTMDMQETRGINPDEERSISFKCVDSQFFTEFDGEWTVTSSSNNGREMHGVPHTNVRYSVDVRPKGPVPVAALEWRIKEDVPINLKAVKKASLKVANELRNSRELTTAQSIVETTSMRKKSVKLTSKKNPSVWDRVGGQVANVAAVASIATSSDPTRRKMLTNRVDWNDDETTATYLNGWSRDPTLDWYNDETTAAYLEDLAVTQRA